MSPVEQKPPLFSGKFFAFLILAVVVFGALLYSGLVPRQQRVAAITEQAKEKESRILTVTVAPATPAPATRELTLPGTVSALFDTPIYARAEGYLRTLKADIGDTVKQGQVLAELETPELDQQLLQSRSRLDQLTASLGQAAAQEKQATANLKLAEITLGRVQQLVTEGVFSKQDGDDRMAQFDVRQAELQSSRAAIDVAKQNIAAQKAEIARLEELVGFKTVRAPFDGVIIVRNAAPGNLVASGSGASGGELFRIASNDTLRVFVSVPQSNIPDIKIGQKAEIRISDRPDEKFTGQVSRDARAVDLETRTQRTEVRVANQHGKLLPGMYVQVTFQGAKPLRMVLAPGDALVMRSDGPYAAVVGKDNRVEFRKLTLGRDMGTQVEILSGLDGDESLIINPSDAVKNGLQVRPLGRS